MGKEWLYWVGGGGGGGSRRSTIRRGRMDGEMKESATSTGCMCSVFQLFDLLQFQFAMNHQHGHEDSFLQQEANTSKGVEAPRNSLELEEPAAMKEEENLNVPVGIRIKTKSSQRISISTPKSKLDNDFSSECSSNSPGTKTPNLVARLMGLDLLPECNSPSFSSSNPKPPTKSHLPSINFLLKKSSNSYFEDDIQIGSHSLPETPRISSGRRSDVEYHRLSLQIIKENINEEFEVSDCKKMAARKGRFGHQSSNENTRPRHLAKQILNQVKENVSRKVGVDITNRDRSEQIRRDENLVLFKPKNKNSFILSRFESEMSCDGKQCNKNRAFKNHQISHPRISPTLPEHQQKKKLTQKYCKQDGHGIHKPPSVVKELPAQAYDHAIGNKDEEAFALLETTNKTSINDKNFKKTPFLNELLKINAPTILPVKKDPSPLATRLPQKQSQASDPVSSKRSTQQSSGSRHSYKLQLNSHKIFSVPENVLSDKLNGCATTPSGGAATEYYKYIQRILKRIGISDDATPLNLAKWYSSSNPLDPSIFYHLELLHNAAGGSTAVLNQRCNRKLVFQLVDELLADILKTHFDLKPWVSTITANGDFRLYGSDLIDILIRRMESFPAANCRSIDNDLCKSEINGFFKEEGESIVSEIEGEIVKSLVHETVAMAMAVAVAGWVSYG